MVVLLVLLTYLIPAAIVAELVYRDAQKNSTQSATMWSLLVLLFFLLGVLMYVLTGRDKLDRKSGVSCHECGANINETDEFCPSCGTEVERIECGNCGETARAGSEFCSKCGHELRKKENIGEGHKNENGFSVSGSKWYYGVLTGGAIWLLVAFLPVDILILGWLLIPLCLYLDMNYLESNSEENIRNTIWIPVFGAIPFINIAVAGGYLYMRYTKIGEPSWSSIKEDKEKTYTVLRQFSKKIQKKDTKKQAVWVAGLLLIPLILILGTQAIVGELGPEDASSLQETRMGTSDVSTYMDPMDRPITPSADIYVRGDGNTLSVTGYMENMEWCKKADIDSAQYDEEDGIFVIEIGTSMKGGCEVGKYASGTMTYEFVAEFEGGTPSGVEILHAGEEPLQIPRSEYS